MAHEKKESRGKSRKETVSGRKAEKKFGINKKMFGKSKKSTCIFFSIVYNKIVAGRSDL